MRKNSTTPKYLVPAVEKACRILEYLAVNNGECLSGICTELDMPKTTVFSILNTLAAQGYVKKVNGSKYTLGVKLYSLGIESLRQLDNKKTFLPYLSELRDKTGFTVYMSFYENGIMTILLKVDSPGIIQFKSYPGERKRLNTSAGGKAICAYLPEAELKIVFANGLDRFTDKSIYTEVEFREHLKEIRKKGYAIDDEEGELGVRCIGVPIFMDKDKVFGSVSLTTIKDNLSPSQYEYYSTLLKDTARKISRELGYDPEA